MPTIEFNECNGTMQVECPACGALFWENESHECPRGELQILAPIRVVCSNRIVWAKKEVR